MQCRSVGNRWGIGWEGACSCSVKNQSQIRPPWGQLAQAQLPTTAPNPVGASLLAMNDNAILQKDRVAFIASKLSSHRGRIVYL